jgi:transposase
MLTYNNKRIYLACGHTDMRKSIDGLSAIVKLSFKLDPFSAAIFAFCNRSRDRIKILEWEGDGFGVYFKRLEKGRFNWPTVNENEVTMMLSGEDFSHLLGSPKVIQKIKRKELKIGQPNENLNLQGLDIEHLRAVLNSTASAIPLPDGLRPKLSPLQLNP